MRTPRDLKYAVLHLQAGTEVLLKARLRQAHWTLVLQDLSAELRKSRKTPVSERFASGNFVSCASTRPSSGCGRCWDWTWTASTLPPSRSWVRPAMPCSTTG
ncbi:hypothetical protein [Streptomyces nigrescens]|uniref:hypothetical protein n=1 Tax=Streptomyces nigrescens TaxID=1920 RepID=UPI0021C39D4A|nr:hypothetical protein [Streptomyces nigrescens]